MCKCANVQMCKLSPLYAEYLKHHSIIRTFAHSHINHTFAHFL
nr:MAG TPA: hypothetical protein [Caudoviricetes sp.]